MDDIRVRQLRESSALSFARSLFQAAEAKELLGQRFFFASAVSAYYSLFHLGAALILAHCSNNPDAPICGKVRKRLQDRVNRQKGTPADTGTYLLPDPAEVIRHDDAAIFVENELAEIAKSLGSRDRHGTLRDMREFVSYAPRLRSDGHTTVLYSGCQYPPEEFVWCLGHHVGRIHVCFREAMQWLKDKSYDQVHGRILTSDFILHEFDGLAVYYEKSVRKAAGDIYRSICEAEGIDWKFYRPEPGAWSLSEEEERRRRRHQEVVDSWIEPA